MSKYEIEQRLQQIQEVRRALAAEEARLRKFLEQRKELDAHEVLGNLFNSMIPK